MIEVDARGYSCPEPVLMAMQAVESSGGQPVRVLVSTAVARDNVIAMAEKKKKTASVEQADDDFAIVIG